MVVVNKYKSSDIYFFTKTVEVAAFTGVSLAKSAKSPWATWKGLQFRCGCTRWRTGVTRMCWAEFAAATGAAPVGSPRGGRSCAGSLLLLLARCSDRTSFSWSLYFALPLQLDCPDSRRKSSFWNLLLNKNDFQGRLLRLWPTHFSRLPHTGLLPLLTQTCFCWHHLMCASRDG